MHVVLLFDFNSKFFSQPTLILCFHFLYRYYLWGVNWIKCIDDDSIKGIFANMTHGKTFLQGYLQFLNKLHSGLYFCCSFSIKLAKYTKWLSMFSDRKPCIYSYRFVCHVPWSISDYSWNENKSTRMAVREEWWGGANFLW